MSVSLLIVAIIIGIPLALVVLAVVALILLSLLGGMMSNRTGGDRDSIW